jgi:hypothetical protein
VDGEPFWCFVEIVDFFGLEVSCVWDVQNFGAEEEVGVGREDIFPGDEVGEVGWNGHDSSERHNELMVLVEGGKIEDEVLDFGFLFLGELDG